MSPDGIREFLYEQIDNEIANAKGRPGIKCSIHYLMNGLCATFLLCGEMQVPIQLIIRGITILKWYS